MCIYYKNKEHLKSKKQASIFPVSLGGQQLMQDTVVSDKAYNYFLDVTQSLIKKLIFVYKMIFEAKTNSFEVLKLQNDFSNLKSIYKYLNKEDQQKVNLECVNLNDFRDNIIKLCAFISFNVLTFLKGEDFVLSDEFDEFREWIIDGTGNVDVLENNLYTLKQNDVFYIPEKAHWCIIAPKAGMIYGIVSLFGMQAFIFKMGKLKNDIDWGMPIGLICDYEKGNEYLIE